MRAPNLTREEIKTTTFSIKREDSTNKRPSLKTECYSGGFSGVIKVRCYSFNIAKGLSQITKKIGDSLRRSGI